jgi:hypothetical protein
MMVIEYHNNNNIIMSRIYNDLIITVDSFEERYEHHRESWQLTILQLRRREKTGHQKQNQYSHQQLHDHNS